ncbi:hydrophobin [Lanmaoa asiatica]|nr:hydrophobin [Lanmaoa asiatica]
MKFAAALVFAAAATVVSAETNAQRLARGLPPNVPGRFKRVTPVSAARRGSPSGTPGGSCNTGSIQCCTQHGYTGSSDPVDSLVGALGINVGAGVLAGLNCSPLSVVGVGGNSCAQQPVCCSDNTYNGIINIGCSPININL